MNTLKIKNQQVTSMFTSLKQESTNLLSAIREILTDSALNEFWASGFGKEFMGFIRDFIVLSAADIANTNENGYLVEVALEARTFSRRDEIMNLKDAIKTQLKEQFDISIDRFSEDHGSTIYIAM